MGRAEPQDAKTYIGRLDLRVFDGALRAGANSSVCGVDVDVGEGDGDAMVVGDGIGFVVGAVLGIGVMLLPGARSSVVFMGSVAGGTGGSG